jgi:hypothetical protein
VEAFIVLVTGIPDVGKSVFRRKFVEEKRKLGLTVEHYDADAFEKPRCVADVDCKRPEVFLDDVIYIIEDIHGFDEEAFMPISAYNLIVYVKSGIFSHMLFWHSRAQHWLESGEFAWDRNTGWRGTQKRYDSRNLLPILRELWRQRWNRRKLIREDMTILSGSEKPYRIVSSIWTRKGITFRWEM